MHNIFTIAKNTFKEAIRDRILFTILGFAVLFIFFTIFLGSISLGEDLTIIRSVGLAGIYIFGIIIAVFLGVQLFHKEIEKRTIYFILSRPVSHAELILGKFFGLFTAVSVTITLMSALYLAVVFMKGGGFDGLGFLASAMTLLELTVFIALAIFFSSFSVLTPLAAVIAAVVILYIGHSLDTLIVVTRKIGGSAYIIARGLYYLLPNLEKFNLRELAVHHLMPSAQEIFFALIYMLIYCGLLLWFAKGMLKRREL